MTYPLNLAYLALMLYTLRLACGNSQNLTTEVNRHE